jgi:carbonic anhydrase
MMVCALCGAAKGPKDLDNPEDPREITMHRLIEGYSRFRTKVFPQHSQLFERLAMGQTPQALFIACSDSRVMPEMVMQCDPGDLFPCRNAGNLVPPPTETTSGVAATIEYAIRVLKIPDVVVCGHSDCGAMKSILQSEDLDKLPMVKSWLQHAGPSSRWLRGAMEDAASWSFEQKLKMLTEANVIMQMQNLQAHPAVAEAVKGGTLQVHGWMYDIGSGAIRRFDPEAGVFHPLIADGQPPLTTQVQPTLKIA